MIMRATQRKMMSYPVSITDVGYQYFSSFVSRGHPSVENGHNPEENHVSSTSLSCSRLPPPVGECAGVSIEQIGVAPTADHIPYFTIVSCESPRARNSLYVAAMLGGGCPSLFAACGTAVIGCESPGAPTTTDGRRTSRGCSPSSSGRSARTARART